MLNFKLKTIFVGLFIFISSFISAQCDIDLTVHYDPSTGIATATWNLPPNAVIANFIWSDQDRRIISRGTTTMSSTTIRVPSGTTSLNFTICYNLKEDGDATCCSVSIVIDEDITWSIDKDDEIKPCDNNYDYGVILDIDCDSIEDGTLVPYYDLNSDDHDDETCKLIVTKCKKSGNKIIKNGIKKYLKNNSKGHNIEQSSIYPNPFNNELNIHIDSKNKCELSIYNVLGKMIFYQEIEPNTQNTKLITAEFQTGIYLYQIISEGNLLKAGKLLK